MVCQHPSGCKNTMKCIHLASKPVEGSVTLFYQLDLQLVAASFSGSTHVNRQSGQ